MDTTSDGWIGARVLRKEDERHLLGAGQFVGDVRMPGLQDIAFVRSPMAHAKIKGITKPEGHEASVFTYEDLGPLKVLQTSPDMPTFHSAHYPALATDRARFAGQPIAACVASTRARAEDIADLVQVDLEELPAVVNVVEAMKPETVKLHDSWPDNAYIHNTIDAGDIDAIAQTAAVKVTRRFKMNRQPSVSLECHGVLAYWDFRTGQLVVYYSTQGPHVMRIGIAEALGLQEYQVRVIAPDVGGGFGGKNRLMPEELAVAALAYKLKTPVRWLEDRLEHLIASPHARDHYYDLTAYADKDGKLLGVAGDVYVDAGAYPMWPTAAFMETSMSARNLPGPYQARNLRARTFTVATNKAPMGPYRGVGRPGACFSIERLMDEIAHELGIEPVELRRRNLVSSFPYETIGGMKLDTGDYHASLNAAAELIGLEKIRERQAKGEADGRRIGLGFAMYTEQSGHGTGEWVKRRGRIIPGYETATTRMAADGTVELLVGIQSHGQGMETTFAQIAAHELGLDPSQIFVRHGDTSISPFGFGTFGSRSIVMGGGAAARSSRTLAKKIRQIGAHLLQCQPEETHLKDGECHGPSGSVPIVEIARAANTRVDLLPPGIDPVLDVTMTYEPAETAGVFSYSTHGALIAVDPDTGAVELLDYVVAEDCGTMINPLVCDGQVQGGVAQGIGTALYEEIPFDEQGQPLATTFADYLMPGSMEIPNIRLAHIVTPALATEYGVKGMGEGGAIAPPAAIANALCDAFKDIRASFDETPLTPRRVIRALDAARAGTRAEPRQAGEPQ